MVTSEVVSSSNTLDALFHPRSIAILGASGRADNPFSRPLFNLRNHDFPGKVYPVNPKYDELLGWTCYPSLTAIPEPVDLVLVMVGAAHVIAAVEECGAIGVKVAIISASGFAEMGDEGRVLQEELLETGRRAGVRLIGPNCQGVISVAAKMAATFTASVSDALPTEGGVAFIGQSGAVGGSVVDLAREAGLGLSEWLSTGNQVDVDVIECAAYLVELPQIRVVTMYLEAAVDGHRFIPLARRAAELGKRLVVLRSGRSDSGRRAVMSHTGAMLEADAAFDVVAGELGVVQVGDVDILLRASHALAVHPEPAGRRIAVVTTSGGAGGLAADQCDERGLDLVELPAELQAELALQMPDFGSTANPVDVSGQLFSRHEDAFRDLALTVGRSDVVDQLVIAVTMVIGDMGARLARSMVEVFETLDKPVHVVWLAGHDLTREGRQIYRDAGVPVYSSVSDMMEVAAILADVSVPDLHDETPEPMFDQHELSGLLAGPVVVESAGHAFLDAAGIPRPWGSIAHSAEQAAELAATVGGPVVMKVQSVDILHKSELGGVRLGLTVDDVAHAWTQMNDVFGPQAQLLVQEMAAPGVEIVVGVTASSTGFPPLVTVGLGGVATELYQDVVTHSAPVTVAEARAMLLGLAASPLLTGFRGKPASDVSAAAEAISRLSHAAVALGPGLLEMEINPLIVAPESGGVCAADFLARFDQTEAQVHG